MLIVALILCCSVAWAEAFPERPGKKIVAKLCSNCHGLKLIEPMRKTREQWQTSVDDMLTRGMKAEDEEVEEVVNYLSKYLSRLNVNKAPAAEIADVLDVGAAQAKLIVDHRSSKGEFKNFDDLLSVPGIDAKKLGEQRDRIAFRAVAF